MNVVNVKANVPNYLHDGSGESFRLYLQLAFMGGESLIAAFQVLEQVESFST